MTHARFLFALGAASVALCQDVSSSLEARIAFDVTSVKPVPPDDDHLMTSYCAGGGRFISRGVPLVDAISWAYDVSQTQIEGGPSWLRSFRTYDIEAVAEGLFTRADCRVMLRALFEDRFGLHMHQETRIVPAFDLVVAKNGPKLSAGDRVSFNGTSKQVTTEQGEPVGWTMGRLANYLRSFRAVQRPVVDRTMLDGEYGFELDYSVADGDDRPDIFTALPEQLGLKLEATKAPIEVWVVDRIERPSGN